MSCISPNAEVGLALASIIATYLTYIYCPLGYFMSCISPNAEVGLALAPVIVIPYLLFGGFFLNTV